MAGGMLGLVNNVLAARIADNLAEPPAEQITLLLILRDNVDEQLARLGHSEPSTNGHPTTNGHTAPKPWLCGAPTKAGTPCRCHVLAPGTPCAKHRPGALHRCGHPTSTGQCMCVVTNPGDLCQHHTPGRAKVVRE